ncbi:MAG: BtpA/SgcQ family protein [Candidatus Hodarchaeales archaeon]|jgi:membrane complex biogenesis BtpA family protein
MIRTVRTLIESLFGKQKQLIGMIHLQPLPGSPSYRGKDIDKIIQQGQEDMAALLEGGINVALIENFGDVPYTRHKIPRRTLAAMSIATREIIKSGGNNLLAFGINVLRNDWESAITMSSITGAKFIRLNVLTGVSVTDQGLIQGDAFDCLNFRQQVYSDLQIFADVFVKHASPLALDPNRDLEIIAKDTVYRGLADAIIVSGTRTGVVPGKDRIKRVREAVPNTPALIGSGLTAENALEMMKFADGAIVGTSLKTEGRIDVNKVKTLVNVLEDL